MANEVILLISDDYGNYAGFGANAICMFTLTEVEQTAEKMIYILRLVDLYGSVHLFYFNDRTRAENYLYTTRRMTREPQSHSASQR